RRAKKGVTTTLSNLGRIEMPEGLSQFVDRFSAFMAAPSQQICISSFGDRMVFGEVSPYSTHEVMLHFFRRLVKLGVDVELASNDYDAVGDKGKHTGSKKKNGSTGRHNRNKGRSNKNGSNKKESYKNMARADAGDELPGEEETPD
ncbi:MAG: hypothetical protein J5966_07025, partial [Lachnospiraceae bacterium]|nr:hypothetical protein [Lachnospiraceae bacterium]